jgi:3-phenylpropionate/cinnamic acid dioxygenase small subunit
MESGAFAGSWQLRSEFEEVLYYESSLISSHKLQEWAELLHEDIRYWVPVRSNRQIGDEDLNRTYLSCHYDDDRQTLLARAQRMAGGFGFADNPPSRLRHFVTNVCVRRTTENEVAVTSNVMVWRSHVGLPDHHLIGGRNDRWVRRADDWLLLERQVVLDHDIILGVGSIL